ncbi:sporulation YhaL family protein [Fictibacillus sp. NPDC058756]|uniref:sporulation YhaL family protein n=1 Tax=Fictibacillus sp. NPDC058756 TaxID=3346625 RepID=UPI00367C3225
MKGYAALFFGAILIAAFVLKEYSAGVSEFFVMTPWWMYFVLSGIIYSGYRATTLFQEDRAIEQKVIEEEGKVYMKRLELARAHEEAKEMNEHFEMAAEEELEPEQKASGE